MKKADKIHLEKVSAFCIVCLNLGIESGRCEIHHIRSGAGMGQRSSHYRAIGLCPIHHRSGGPGTALHAGQEAFEATFGTEEELLAQVLALI